MREYNNELKIIMSYVGERTRTKQKNKSSKQVKLQRKRKHRPSTNDPNFKKGARPRKCNGINRNGENNEQRTKVNHKVNNNAKGVSISKKGITIKIY